VGFDYSISGFFGILPDSTAGLLRFKCVLTLVTVSMMVSALKPVYVGRGCHSWYQSRTKRAPELKDFIKILAITIAFAKYVGSLRMVSSS